MHALYRMHFQFNEFFPSSVSPELIMEQMIRHYKPLGEIFQIYFSNSFLGELFINMWGIVHENAFKQNFWTLLKAYNYARDQNVQFFKIN